MTNSKMVGMTLNYLGSQTTVRQLARQYGIMTDCFIQCMKKVMKLLMDNCHKVIKWPERDEYATIAANFDKSLCITYCFGCFTLHIMNFSFYVANF